MLRWLACLLALALAAPVAARPVAPTATDSVRARPFAGRDACRGLAVAGRTAAIDSLAMARLEQLVARREPDSLEVADALVSAIETRCVSGHARDPRLAGCVARALAIHASSPGPDSLWLARTLQAAGEWHYRLHELDTADAMLQRVLAIRQRVLPPDDIEVAATLRGLATIAVLGSSGARQDLARRAWEIAAKRYGPDDPRTGAYLAVLAGEQNLNGDRLVALHGLERVLALNESVLGGDHPEIDRARFNVAVLAMLVGDYVRAHTLLERNFAYESTRSTVDSLRVAMTLGAEVECLNELGDYEAALGTSTRQLAFRADLLPPHDAAVYEGLYQRSRALAGVGRFAEAIAGFDTVLAGQTSLDSLGSVPILLERAAARRAAADTAGTLRDVERAARLAALASRQGPLSQEHALLWARCLDDAGRWAEALPKLEAALALADSTMGPRSPAHTALVLEKARALSAARDPGAFAAAREGAALQCEQLRAAARGFPERQALLYARRTGLGFDALLVLAARGALSAGQRRDALERVIEARSLVLDEVAARQRLARAARDTHARALLDSLGEARATLARWLVRGRGGAAEDSARAVARAEAERIEERLAALGLTPPPAGSTATATRLAGDEVLVSYVEYASPAGGPRTERRLLAFVSKAGAAPEVVPLGAAEHVDALVAGWRARTGAWAGARATDARAARAQRAAGSALRACVWDPLAPHLVGARRVLIVPDGALQLVAFDALPDRDGRYLVEHEPLLVRIGTERDLGRPDAGAAPAGRLLAVGGPDFDSLGTADLAASAAGERGMGIECAGFRSARFGRLPGAALEVEDVAARWRAAGGEALLLSGARADEATFKRVAPTCASLHLATHGFFLGHDCTNTDPQARGIGGLVAANVLVSPSGTSEATNPLRLAGLAMAGANRRDEASSGDDGVLTAEEISALDLSRVHDVVLSACDSGVGDIAAGEGVLGLQRAFQIAGARTLVVSLWPVGDRAARAWMDGYYDARVTRALAAPDAARAASRARLVALRRAGRPAPPSAWAGFVTIGR